MFSLIFAQLLTILLAGGLRFGPAAVVPGGGQALWIALMALLVVGLSLALWRETRAGQAPWRGYGRVLLWLIFPGAAAINWSLGESTLLGGIELPILALVMGLVVAVLVYRREEWALRDGTRSAWLTAARWILVPTAVCVALVLNRGSSADGLALAMMTYPIYAAAQLAAALVLPWTQWERDGVPPIWRVAGVAILFGMIHWPNPFATAATAGGMLLWALAWRAGSSLIPLALSMGILAAVVTQSLPDQLTAHMRIGANYVLKGAAIERELWLDGEADRINKAAAWSSEEGLRPWLSRALPEVMGQPVDEGLIEATEQELRRLHREYLLRWFFDSEEFRYYQKIDSGLETDELRFFESTFVPHHPGHARYVEFVDEGESMTTREFVRQAYLELLGREPGEPEFGHWPAPITLGTRWQFIRRILDGGSLRAWKEPESEEARARLMESRQATPR